MSDLALISIPREKCSTDVYWFETAGDLFEKLKEHVAAVAEYAITARGRFAIVLTGGRTVAQLYNALRGLDAQWASWHIFWSDERCAPAGHMDRNNRLAEDAWLRHVPIPPSNVHAMPAELGAEEAALSYTKILEKNECFDLVLLSIGEDGHIASIFPGEVSAEGSVVSVQNAPKLPRQRVTMTINRLAQAREVVILGTGEGKRRAVSNFLHGIPSPATELVKCVPYSIWVDAEAAPKMFNKRV